MKASFCLVLLVISIIFGSIIGAIASVFGLDQITASGIASTVIFAICTVSMQ